MINQPVIAKNISAFFPSTIKVRSDFDPLVKGMSLDSRDIHSHELFVAKIGAQFDGRDFIDAAVANGASVVLSEQETPNEENFYLHESGCPVYRVENVDNILGEMAATFYESNAQQVRIIGVTGTNGKTSVCQFLAQALTKLGYRVAVLGTIGNGFLPKLEYSTLTTQDAISLHKMLRQFSDQGADFICMEVSSHSLDQQRVSGINFSNAIFTNLSQDHLDYHHTLENYAAAKEKLFHFSNLKFAAINLDKAGIKIQNDLPESVSSLGLGADLIITQVLPNKSALVFQFQFRNENFEINNPFLMGEFNAQNLALCFLTLVQLGVDQKQACELLNQVLPAQGRLQKIQANESVPDVYVDFAHTPDALEKTLVTLTSFSNKKIILVFGCGGDRDRTKRSQMAAIAEKFANIIFVTSDNPRKEAQSQIASDIFSGFSDRCLSKVHRIDDRQAAIEKAISLAGKDDLVLIAGKGHEGQQIFADKTIAFSDEEVALTALASLQKKEALQ